MLQVIDDTTLACGDTEFTFSDGNVCYAKQQHNVAGAPFADISGMTHEQKVAVKKWSGCEVN